MNRYFEAIKASHLGNADSSFHVMQARTMKLLLYDFGILTDASNHGIVEEAIKAAKKEKTKLRKMEKK